ncbi:MAG TPA: hypothetical protein VFV35_01745, partial [Acidimicrobiales bacterium]|nr:hypothetical protein [Acidimicrobiales bacterium]
MTTLVVDWLGRGGIAQYARAWADVIPGSTIVSRAGRELDGDDVIAVPTRPPAIRAHLQMAVAVTRS